MALSVSLNAAVVIVLLALILAAAQSPVSRLSAILGAIGVFITVTALIAAATGVLPRE